ncbi:hypothetical protein Taro_050514 [Colocasia esculenta]|uniref:Uncharacterized protein n=1 Tax=Colocasia esculenta TaxID=4460 RepID=A0A843XE47_COLES|nr:hypothetical protein [Colocasia esculenta]
MTRPPSGRGTNLYCDYHKEFSHTTDQRQSLKVEISKMLRRGIIGKDVMDGLQKERTPEEERGMRGGKGAVLVLAGGSACGGDSGRKRKAYASASAYNAIFGRDLLGKLGGVPSTYHQKLKFPTPNGIGEVMGNKTDAHRCYVNSSKAKEPIISKYEPVHKEDVGRHEPSEQTKQKAQRLARRNDSISHRNDFFRKRNSLPVVTIL